MPVLLALHIVNLYLQKLNTVLSGRKCLPEKKILQALQFSLNRMNRELEIHTAVLLTEMKFLKIFMMLSKLVLKTLSVQAFSMDILVQM